MFFFIISFYLFEWISENNYFDILERGDDLIFFGGRGVALPHLFCMNILVKVKLGYTLNFSALVHLEVP